MPTYPSLRVAENIHEWTESRPGRTLQIIRRDMDITSTLMLPRLRNEEVLSLSYRDGNETNTQMASADSWENVRQNALNLPYRYLRWLESQATSKKMIVKVNRDAGAGQKKGGPADDETGMWLGIALERVAYEAGFHREMKALIGEVVPRGTSVLSIGYHEVGMTRFQEDEVGKDAQSIVPEVLQEGDLEAKPGQAHSDISKALGQIAEDPEFQIAVGREGVEATLERKASHDDAVLETSMDDSPIHGARDIRHRIWLRKRRVGEDVGWAPWVYDTEDTEFWWERNIWTVAQVKASPLFTDEFKEVVKGYDGRNVSEVTQGGKTESTDSMGSDARQAQTDGILEDDERMVEWYAVWYRRPDMPEGGIRKIVCPETPNIFIESDESNPHVGDDGYGLIPGFFPFYDFTPVLSSLTVPERTRGIPPMSVGMTQFEKIAEYNRLRHESALRHSLRLYQIHPGLKSKAEVLKALQNGEDGYAFIAEGVMTMDGKMANAVEPVQFTGNTQEIDRQAAREEGDWIKVMGMPPAVLQGMGTAKTATQDQQGIAAGERESGAIITSFEIRMQDVMAGIRGLMRGCYDDEDFITLLGEAGAEVLKAWQIGTTDDGDEITVTFGVHAQAQETVERKQLMEAITLEKNEVEPVTGLPMYDSTLLFEELHRRLDVGPPKKNDGPMLQLQQAVIALMAEVERLGGGPDAEKSGKNGKSSSPSGGSRPSEGGGPTQGTLQSGVMRGTVTQGPQGAPR